MSDYIKREDAIKTLEGWKISGEMILATVPSADVVEVVRCEDCKYFAPLNNDDHGVCDGRVVYHDDFCSDGEKA